MTSLKAASSAKFRREVFLFEALYSDGEVDQASPKSRRALSRSSGILGNLFFGGALYFLRNSETLIPKP